MKAKTNTTTTYTHPTTVCILIGYYNVNANYCEEVWENVNLNDLPNDIVQDIDLNHDISLQIIPGDEIRVFVKDMDTLKAYLEINNKPDNMKSMFDNYAEYSQLSGYRICGTQDLENLKGLSALLTTTD